MRGHPGQQRGRGAPRRRRDDVVAIGVLLVLAVGLAVGATSEPSAAADGSAFATITPCRLADTRAAGAGGAFAGGQQRSFQVAGTGAGFAAQGGASGGCAIPTTATAVEATITAVSPTGAGYARAWPAGTALPNATFLNFSTGQSIGNTGTIPIATTAATADLAVQVFGAGTHLVIDVSGYYAPGGTLHAATITPCRIVDTRAAGAGGAFAGGQQRSFQVAGTGAGFAAQGGASGGCAIPTTATAVEATITAVSPTGAGYARAWPAGTALPNATFLNFSTSQSIGNTGTIPIATTAATADLAVAAFGAGTHIVIDISGYYATTGPLGYTSITPCRIVDTRAAGAGGAFAAGQTRTFQVAGTGPGFAAQGGATGGCAIPDTTTAVEATVTAVGPNGAGFSRTYPSGTALPNATFLNFSPDQSIGNTGTIPLSPTAAATDLNVAVFGAGTHVVIDVQGYFTADGASPVVVSTTTLPTGAQGSGYTATLAATGGAAPYSWTLASGALPTGLALSSSGQITGTPTAAGTSTFTVRATDALARPGTRALTLTVTGPSDWAQPRHDAGGTGWNPSETTLTNTNAPQVHQEWEGAPATPAIVAGVLYRVGILDTDPNPSLTASTLADGTVTWKVPLDPYSCGSGTPVVTATTVVVVCGSAARAYDIGGTHALLWTTAETDPGSEVQYAQVIGTTLLTWSSTRVAAFRLSDGQRIWQQGLPSGAGSIYDVAASGTTVAVAYDDRLRGLSLTTGAQTWTRTGVKGYAVVIAGGWIYTNDTGSVSRFDLATGAPGWIAQAGGNIYDIVAADADTVYAWDATFDFGPPSPSILRALKTSDGTQRWQYDVPSRVGATAVTGDVVWLTSTEISSQGRSSDLIALARSTGAERRRIHFTDNIYAGDGIAFGGGRVAFTQGGSAGWPEPGRFRVFGLAPPLPVIDAEVLPLARVGTTYSHALTAHAGTPGFTWSLAAGTLPTGLSLSAGGTLSGTPTATGTSRITLRVTDAAGRVATQAVILAVVGGAPGDWTTTGRDATGNAFDPGEATVGLDAAPGLAFRWKTENPAGDVTFDSVRSPVVVGSRLYDVTRDGELRAWDTTGTTTNRVALWHATADQTTAGTTFYGAPTYSAGVLYLLDSRGALEAVRASDGVGLWTSDTTLGFGTNDHTAPLVVGTTILVETWTPTSEVHAFSTVDGSPLWGGASTTLAGTDGTRPLVSDGTLAFAKSGCDLYALSVATGAIAWQTEIVPGGSSGCIDYTAGIDSPVVVGGVVYAGSGLGLLAADAATGSVIWRRGAATPESGVVVGGVWLVTGDRFGSGSLTAYDATTGDTLWSRTGVGIASVSAAGDLVVVRSAYAIKGYSRLTGEDAWDGGASDGFFSGAATIARGRLYTSSYYDGDKAYGPLV